MFKRMTDAQEKSLIEALRKVDSDPTLWVAISIWSVQPASILNSH
jgi:hypothetical protein